MKYLLLLLLFYVVSRILGRLFKSSGNTSSRINNNNYEFEVHLIALSSIVIKADGQVSRDELDYVRRFFVQSFGKDRANEVFKIFNEQVKHRSLNPAQICHYLVTRTSYETRLQLLHFLFNIAKADGSVSQQESLKIYELAGLLRIARADVESIAAMFSQAEDRDYKILEVDENASVEEIKVAYRQMAKKYHPDKLMHMSEEYRKGAQEKFNSVQQAYENLKRKHGF